MNNINGIRLDRSKFLQILENIDKPPKRLYYRGTIPSERRPSVAIVGSRKPTAYGREVTERLASSLARRGIVIISGLALGIDAIAHRAAVEVGGTTIAVQANGLDRLYPSANRSLADDIIHSSGAIISEYEPGIEPMRHRFLERNRLVSGMADIVIVTEAAARSGTLNTVAHALAQGKEIFVVPGNITSPMSAGCNQLLRQGAQPLLEPEDILDILLPNVSNEQSQLPISADPIEQAIIDAIASGMRDGDAILQSVNCATTDFTVALTTLELNGMIVGLGANQWRLN